MSTHIYIHSLHIFVYAHVFAHIQIHYFQAGILLTLAVALKGDIAMCIQLHNMALSSNCTDDIQLQTVQITSAYIIF